MSISSKNIEILNLHLQVENKHDIASTLKTLHPDCIYEDVALGKIYKGHDGAKTHYQLWWNAFDLIVKNESRHIAEDGTIILEQHYTGTHTGDFYGLSPTNNPIDIRVVTVISFRDNLMAGERSYYDARGLLAQIGEKNFPALNK